MSIAASAVVLIAGAAIGLKLWYGPSAESRKSEPTMRQITSNTLEASPVAAAISPDGKYVAYVDLLGTHLRDIDTGATHSIVPHDTLDVLGLGWFPDGNRLRLTAQTPGGKGFATWVVPILGGAPRKLRDDAGGAQVSPDGSQILFHNLLVDPYGSSLKGIWVMGPNGENARQLLPDTDGVNDIQYVAWSPNGKKVLLLRGNRLDPVAKPTLAIYDLATSQPIALFSIPKLLPIDGGSCLWLPDHRIIVTLREPAPNDSSVNLWEIRLDPRTNATSGEPKRLTSWVDSSVAICNATRDGKRLAFLKMRTQLAVYAADLEDGGRRLRNVRRVTFDSRDQEPSAWTRDSRSIYFSSKRQGTLDIFKQEVEARLAEPVVSGPAAEAEARLSPDGSLLLYMVRPAGLDAAPSRLMRVPVAGGAPELILEGEHIFDYQCPTSPAASCVVVEFQDRQATYSFLDPVKGKGREILHEETAVPAWGLSPDGSRLVLIGSLPNPSIRVVNVSDGRAETLPLEGLASPAAVSWSFDGKALFFSDVDVQGKSPLWRLVRAELTGQVHVLHRAEVPFILFYNLLPSPDGRYLAFLHVFYETNAWIVEDF